MSGRHKFSDLEARLPPIRRARIARLAEKLEVEIGKDEPGAEHSAGGPDLVDAEALSSERRAAARPGRRRGS